MMPDAVVMACCVVASVCSVSFLISYYRLLKLKREREASMQAWLEQMHQNFPQD